MAELKYNNEAGRLHRLFCSFHEQDPNVSVLQAWWYALNMEAHGEGKLPSNPTPAHVLAVQKRLADMGRSLASVEEQIAVFYPDEITLYTDEFATLEQSLAPLNWTRTKNEFSLAQAQAGLNALRHCAKDLPQQGRVGVHETTALYVQLHKIKDEIASASIVDPSDEAQGILPNPDDERSFNALKRWLLMLVDEMLRALDEYELCGNKAFDKVSSRIVGEFILKADAYGEAKKAFPEQVNGMRGALDTINEWLRRTQEQYGPTINFVAPLVLSAIDKL